MRWWGNGLGYSFCLGFAVKRFLVWNLIKLQVFLPSYEDEQSVIILMYCATAVNSALVTTYKFA